MAPWLVECMPSLDKALGSIPSNWSWGWDWKKISSSLEIIHAGFSKKLLSSAERLLLSHEPGTANIKKHICKVIQLNVNFWKVPRMPEQILPTYDHLGNFKHISIA